MHEELRKLAYSYVIYMVIVSFLIYSTVQKMEYNLGDVEDAAAILNQDYSLPYYVSPHERTHRARNYITAYPVLCPLSTCECCIPDENKYTTTPLMS